MHLPAEAPRHVHLDAVGGIAGDMFVAALLDALPDLRRRVMDDVAAVVPLGLGTALLQEGTSNAVRCLRFVWRPVPDAPTRHASRFKEMVALIERAELAHGTATHAIAILSILADAEAAIHRVPVDQVHFHEIGDWDSLVDVVAAGSIVAALGNASWSVSPLPQGSGLVRTRHGLLPVPAPATASILLGFAWRDDGIDGERVTPTGAAILRHVVGGERPAIVRLQAVGTGAGLQQIAEMPNILRASVAVGVLAPPDAPVMVLAFDIDDMTGEELAVAADRLRALDGVLDLSTVTRRGKKGRPLESFQLLVRPDALEAVRGACLTETSTIGLRWHQEDRLCLPRTRDERGGVRRKRVERPDGSMTVKAESDDLAGATLAQRRQLAARSETPP